MAKAWIENNVIRDVCAGDPDTLYHPDIAAHYVAEVPENVSPGWVLINDVWVEPAAAEGAVQTFLHITYTANCVVGDTINISLAVKFADGTLAPVNATYRVPVIRDSDGRQVKYLKAVFAAGLASVSFTATEPGKLVMDVSKIDPRPTSVVVDWPEIFVDEA